MGLADAADRLASTYSGGMIRRLELAQALVNRPRAAVARRAHDRPRPLARDGVWERVAGAPRGDRHDRAAHHPLHGGGRRALRPRGPHAPRPLRADRHTGRTQGASSARGRDPARTSSAHHTGSSSTTKEGGYREVAQTLAAQPAGWAEPSTNARWAAFAVSGDARRSLSGRAAEAPSRSDRGLHPSGPAGPLAAHLRRDLQPPTCHPHRRCPTWLTWRPASWPSRHSLSRSSTASRSSGSATPASWPSCS